MPWYMNPVSNNGIVGPFSGSDRPTILPTVVVQARILRIWDNTAYAVPYELNSNLASQCCNPERLLEGSWDLETAENCDECMGFRVWG